jgi:hypothetical protein
MASVYALVLQRHRWSARPEHVAHSRAHSAHNAAGGLCTFVKKQREWSTRAIGKPRALAEGACGGHGESHGAAAVHHESAPVVAAAARAQSI